MATTRITEKLSDIVRRQFPEHIQTENEQFLAFVEAYYRFLEQDQGAQELIQNAMSYHDVDRTTEAFIQYFLNQYGPAIPRTILANKPHLIKQLKALYEAKGSELSFKMLFRILYNSDVSISYPFENVLRASDGEWQQRASVRVELITGSITDLKNRFLVLTKGIRTYNTPINSVKRLSSTIVELYLDTSLLGPYVVGDVVTISNGSSIIFTGRISPTTVTAEIIYGGKHFKVGQIFTINYQGAVNTLIKVTSIGVDGAITGLSIINYGYGFTDTLTTYLNPSLPVNTSFDAYISTTQGFDEFVDLYRYDPADAGRYFFGDYVEDQPPYAADLVDTQDDSYNVPVGVATGVQSEELATIRLSMGALGRYPGTFVSNRGFLSEDQIRLENDKQYKAFTYQTNTDVDLSVFFDIVKKLVHVAGNDLYNNRIIQNDINLSANVELLANSIVAGYLTSTVEINDSITLTVV